MNEKMETRAQVEDGILDLTSLDNEKLSVVKMHLMAQFGLRE